GRRRLGAHPLADDAGPAPGGGGPVAAPPPQAPGPGARPSNPGPPPAGRDSAPGRGSGSGRSGVRQDPPELEVHQLKGPLLHGDKAVDPAALHPGLSLPAVTAEETWPQPDLFIEDGHGLHLPPWSGGSAHPYAAGRAWGPQGDGRGSAKG